MTKALAKTGPATALAEMLEERSEAVAEILPAGVTVSQLKRSYLLSTSENPKLLACTKESQLRCYLRGAHLGFEFGGPFGYLYAVPFGTEATLIVGYRAFVALLYEAGAKRVDGAVVYENDAFTYRRGMSPLLNHEPLLAGERGNELGAWVLIETSDGSILTDWMNTEDIEKIRNGARSKDSPAWKNHWGEMAKKVVLRRRAKTAPLRKTERLATALETDSEDYREPVAVEAPPAAAPPIVQQPEETQADALSRRLKQERAEAEKSQAASTVQKTLSETEKEHPLSLAQFTDDKLRHYSREGLEALCVTYGIKHTGKGTVPEFRKAIAAARDGKTPPAEVTEPEPAPPAAAPQQPEPAPSPSTARPENWAQQIYGQIEALATEKNKFETPAKAVVAFDNDLMSYYGVMEIASVPETDLHAFFSWCRVKWLLQIPGDWA